MVRFRATATPRQQSQVLADAKVSVDHRIVQLGVVVVRMAPERRDRALIQLRASPWVARAEKDAVVEVLDTTPNDSIWTDQWGCGGSGFRRRGTDARARAWSSRFWTPASRPIIPIFAARCAPATTS